MNEKIEDLLRKALKDGSTHEEAIKILETKLDQELDKGEDADFDLVNSLVIFINRMNNVDDTHDSKALIEEIKKETIKRPEKKVKRMPVRMMAAVLSVFIVMVSLNLFTTTAYSFNILDAVVSFIENGFSLDFEEQNEEVKYYDCDYLKQYTLDQLDVIPVLPQSIGEDFEQIELNTVNDGEAKIVAANYVQDKLNFKIKIVDSAINTNIDGDYIEAIKINDITYYISEKGGYFSATYSYDDMTIDLCYNGEYEDFLQIIRTSV